VSLWRKRRIKFNEDSKMPLYIVDTIVSYRMKYAIQADELEHAYDEVTCNDGAFDEITQRCLGEQIIDGREITMVELHDMLNKYAADKDEMCSSWMGEKLVRKVDYDGLTIQE